MKQPIICALVLSFTLLIESCNTTEPQQPDNKPTLELKLEDISCLKANMTIIYTNLQLQATLTQNQNIQDIETIYFFVIMGYEEKEKNNYRLMRIRKEV